MVPIPSLVADELPVGPERNWTLPSFPRPCRRKLERGHPEADILADGSLDSPDDILAAFDFVVAGDGIPWDAVVEALCGKGVHLMAPFEERVSHDQAHEIARRLVSELAARFPARYIVSAQANRKRRIFLDYLR